MAIARTYGYAELGDPMPRDTRVLDDIAAVLNRQTWTPTTVELIANILRATGRTVCESQSVH